MATFFRLRIYSLLLASIFTFYNSIAQDPFPDYPPIYQDDVISRVDILIPPDSLAIILAPGNEESEYHFHATFIFDNGTIRDTFDNAGFQLRGNTSRYAKKKSFQVSLNKYVPGRLWYGVEKINLNGEHNDPTVSRSKIAWDLLREIGVPAPRSSHVKLYINNTYYGLYANVEHIDEEFVLTRFGNKDGNLYKCLWPADMVYLGSDPELYKLTSGDRRVYELKTNEEKDDYADLAHLIDVLNNTPVINLRCELEKVFNINSFLLSMAFDILSGNWDGPLYNKNNFFLYHNQATGLFEFMPYDLDNTFGIDWFNINWAERNIYSWGHDNEPRPLYWKILQVPEYRDRLSYYLKKIIDEHYNETILFPKLDYLKNQLASSIAQDEYYTLDYGFSLEDFLKGFNQTLPYNHTPIGIKPFISTRRDATIDQLDLQDIAPIIMDVETNHPTIYEPITIRATVEDDQGIESVDIIVQVNGGAVEVVAMYDDGLHEDDEALDGIYGVVFSPQGTCLVLNYAVVATDLNENESRHPVCGLAELVVCNSSLTLAVNEFMASNETTIADEFGEYEDWVEIYNYGTETIDLGDLYLTDKPDNPVKWQFPDTSIQTGEYMLIWADEDLDQGVLHADIKLSAGGEYIGIYDNNASGNALIDGLEFGEQEADVSFGRFPNGTGDFQFLLPTPGSMNELTLSNSENKNQFPILIYPNPARDIFYLECDELYATQHSFVLLNVFGQSIIEQRGKNKMTFAVSHLPSGIYFLGVKEDQGFQILGKVVKQ